MRPTWNAETIVDPFENVSGSTSVLWLVVVDPAQVAWVNGSVLMSVVAARAAAGRSRIAATAALSTAARRLDGDCTLDNIPLSPWADIRAGRHYLTLASRR